MTPCIGVCTLQQGFCIGCLRSATDISNWGDIGMNSRKEIMEKLKRQFPQVHCPSCGSPNNCKVEQGKSISSCWCFGLPATEAEEIQENCYCRTCLTGKTKTTMM